MSTLSGLFTTILNMSITASYVAVGVILVRLLLKKFNPLMWLSFALMNRDMEMSCDESVLHKMNPDAKGGYSSSLLALSVKRNGLFAANPLAFGESHVKARIKNVLNYKKPEFWVIVLAVMATAVLIVAFTTNPKHEQSVPNSYWGYSIDALMDNKTTYVGNNVKVIGLIDAMPLPEGITRDTVELQTDYLPYGITINYIMNDSSNV
ncbi:MAG: M56 family metallopeptidase, partial [Desulfotomaculaceae bacterium]|nr:M56 family metallopeptidase [Desulfotomaculaceae bacterium]